ncbi:MAG: hypothetical protein QOH25_3351 [Acidobacteriota bacterium]|jgi:hypothetical protein|nr:hypothetical protein [Acidobacteriota bacterium]
MATREFDSKERVAFDLMTLIADKEDADKYEKPDPRTYYLKLFHQCNKATSGNYAIAGILDEG